MKTAGMLTNGGDTPSLNALLYYIRKAVGEEGYTKIYGFRGGYRGLIVGEYDDITRAGINPNYGGTFLNSLRFSPVPKSDEDYRKNTRLWDAKLQGALGVIGDLDLDLLVVIGGDGTLSATAKFMPYIEGVNKGRCKVVGVPRTIDNDITTYTHHNYRGHMIETSLCPGFPSAAENVIRSALNLRTTASSTHRAFTFETMGRNAGWLALAAAAGSAEKCTVPEWDITEQVEQTLYDLCATEYQRSKHIVVGVSEGTTFSGRPVKQAQYGERKLGGAGDLLAKGGKVFDDGGAEIREVIGLERALNSRLARTVYPKGFEGQEECGIPVEVEVRCQHGDYHPRMGNPNRYDIALARVLGYERLRAMVHNGEFGSIPVLSEVVPLEHLELGVTGTVLLDDVANKPLPLRHYYDTDRMTATPAYGDFLHTIVDMKALLADGDIVRAP